MAGRSRPAVPRPVPTRSCVACRTARPKRELLRVVRALDGSVALDPTGRANGRGAYLCRDAVCWDAAGRRRALEHALRTSVPASLAAILAAGPAALDTNPDLGAGATDEPDNNEGGRSGQE